MLNAPNRTQICGVLRGAGACNTVGDRQKAQSRMLKAQRKNALNIGKFKMHIAPKRSNVNPGKLQKKGREITDMIDQLIMEERWTL